jgi:hypothetical protein
MNNVVTMLRQLEAARFYGSLEIKFEAGRVVLLRKTESIKPSEHYPANGGSPREYESHRS